jgi:hypothetical protein
VNGFDPDGALDSTQLVVVGLVTENESTHSELKKRNKMFYYNFKKVIKKT